MSQISPGNSAEERERGKYGGQERERDSTGKSSPDDPTTHFCREHSPVLVPNRGD